MASPKVATVTTLIARAKVPVSSPPSKEETIWKRLIDAGFDKEMIERRDKAALVSYIAQLESEFYEYQQNLGLLILEKKEWMSKYEQVQASADVARDVYKCDEAAHSSALAEARKQEENLKRALAIERECVANIEKALHDMRVEAAETKLTYENKILEARKMMKDAQRKLEEAEVKVQSAESLHAEASRFQSAALINIQDISSREDDLRRRQISFQAECDAKEKELSLQRQSLYDSKRILHQEQERILEGKTLLNQRQNYIYEKTKELSHLENELNKAKAKYEEECHSISERRSNIDLDSAALTNREEALMERESELDRREHELLLLKEKILRKEYDELQKLVSEHRSTLEKKKQECEAEFEMKRKLFKDDIEARTLVFVEKELEFSGREDFLKEKETYIEVLSKKLCKQEEDISKKLKLLDDKEENLKFIKMESEKSMLNLKNEKEEMKRMQLELETIRNSLEDKRKEILLEQKKVEISYQERNDLLVLESKLKEEIDSFRRKKSELDLEADKLRAEKEEFEVEWDLFDEKKEEIRNEAERVANERNSITAYFKNEHDSIKLEKEKLRDQFKSEADSLSREREDFMKRTECEHSEWVLKIQRERDDFIRDILVQRKELENCIEKRREEVEDYLKEKKEAFEQEKAKELHYINSQKEIIVEQLKHVASELKRLDNERMEIALDRERREREWAELKSSIEMLDIMREKLQRQRELLHADRKEIDGKIQHLNKLENLDIDLDTRSAYAGNSNHALKKCANKIIDGKGMESKEAKSSVNSSPSLSATSFVKKYARAMFRSWSDTSDCDEAKATLLLDKGAENVSEIQYKISTDKLNVRKRVDESTKIDEIDVEYDQEKRKKAKHSKFDAVQKMSPIC